MTGNTTLKKIGIIGNGRIARRFVKEEAAVADVEIAGVYNPHLESAERFASEQGIGLAARSMEELFAAVDMVYIASPHGSHVDYARSALAAGKNVLCEKPMSFSKSEAEGLFELADRQGVTLLEGIKTAYCPGFHRVVELARSGMMGKVRYIEACFTKLVPPDSRELTDPEYGGSFCELGTYVMLPALMLFGSDYQNLTFDSIRDGNGADLFTKASLRYEEGYATLTTGLGVKADGSLMIAGETGFIHVPAPWWKTTKIEVHYEDPNKVDHYEEPFEGDGLRYELSAFLAGDRSMREVSVGIAEMMEQFSTFSRNIRVM